MIDEFSPYVCCIASVSFHVTKGHVVDSVHPKQHSELLPPAFLAAIARLSLPDMTIDREGDVKFTFRFRFADEFYFGCVFFRQQRDEQEKRGYMQKSVVVLTRSHEFVSLCQDLAQVIGPVFFSYSCNCEVLEQCCVDVKGWAQPSNGVEPVFTVAGTRLQSAGQFPAPHKMFTDVPLFATFGSLAVSLWPLWELVLTGQSILVLGPTPDRCSKAVLGICSLIAPVPMRYDFRPFLTVLDHDFARLCDAKQNAPPPCVVGGSNPFLLKCFEHFPNLVSLGSASSTTPSALQSNGNLLPAEFGLFRRTPTLRSLLKSNKWDVPLLITKDRQLVVGREDKLLQRLKQGTNAQNNELLRQYFYALTKRFLEPLESFLRIRASGEVRAYQDDTCARAFGLESFLYFLSKQPPAAAAGRAVATTKPFPAKLYEGFVQGPNFSAWLELELAALARERFTIMRTLIVETSSRELLGIRGMEDRVVHYIELEQAKGSDKDRELCSKMYEHLNALQQDQPCL